MKISNAMGSLYSENGGKNALKYLILVIFWDFKYFPYLWHKVTQSLFQKYFISPVTKGKIFSQNCEIVIPYLSVLLQHKKMTKLILDWVFKRTFSYPCTLHIQKVFRDFLCLCYYILFITTIHELGFRHGNHPVWWFQFIYKC